ncbi:MAG: FtsX-like permease family protein [Frankiaceae bacterium]|nr:FtsX-like permease family protein [Frankiaceae bacterium]MBV9869627.1 FtsX-like permease family protein [Frankiaceae bacterium]
MAAVLAFARLDLRRRWRSLVVLALLITMAGGVIIATTAGARRTDTVLTRLNSAIAPADVMVLPNQPGFRWGPVRRLPAVKTLGTFVLAEGVAPKGVGFDFGTVAGFPGGDLTQNIAIDRPKIISGRTADPSNPYEIVASPGFVGKYGRTISVQLPSKAQVDSLRPGSAFPPGTTYAGPTVQLHVVGIGVNTFDLGPGGGPVYMPTHAFFVKFIKPVFPYFKNARVILNGGAAAIPEFSKELASIPGDADVQVADQHTVDRILQRTATFTTISWLLFALIALVASLILLGQAFARFGSGATDELRALSAVGMDRTQIRLAAASGPVIASVAGTIGAVGSAIAMSSLFPSGIAGKYEPTPGTNLDPLVLSLGGIGVLGLGILGAYVSSRTVARESADEPDHRSWVASTASRSRLHVSAVLGTRFALEPGRGKARVPVRPALAGAAAGVIGVVGALTFRAGLSGTVDDLNRYGQTFDAFGFVSEGAPPPSFAKALSEVKHDPDIAALDDMRVAVVTVNGRPTSTTSITPIVGSVDIVALSGRAPVGPDEISLGPTTAKDLGMHAGDTVSVDGHQLTVSGVTFVPENPHNDYTDGAWLTTAGFAVVQPSQAHDKFHEVRFDLAPGVDPQAAFSRLPKGLAPGGVGLTTEFITPQQQIELRSVRIEPMLLGGFLLLLATGAVGHGLATAVRRRRRDVAVLRALGMTRWQTRLIVIVQATVLALVGLVIGIPLGVAIGRTGWRVLAHATPVLYVAPLALAVVLGAVPATVAAANALATVPARRAARLRVSEILRAE